METVQVRRWTRQEYEQMAEAGILDPEARFELLDGEIIEVSPQKRLHASAILLVQEALREAFGAAFTIQTQLPLALGDASMPEPDVAVVPGTPRDYRDTHPGEALLVVEVAESSLALDRGRKLHLYARSGVPEYWIINLVDYCVEVYRDPSGDVYRTKSTHVIPGQVASAARPGVPVDVADLLP